MNRIFVLFILLIGFSGFGQKLKTEHYQVKYIKPPKSELKINKTYTWHVQELTRNENMQKVTKQYFTKDLNYGRGQFFASRDGLGFIPGFKNPLNGISFNGKDDMALIPASLVKVLVGIAEIAQVKPNTNGRVNPNSAESAMAKVYDVWIHVPLVFDMRYAQPGEGVDEFSLQMLQNVKFDSIYCLKEEGQQFSKKFQFPKDLSQFKLKKGYSTTAELELQFVKYKRQFVKECKDRIIMDFLKRAKLEVESRFSYSKRDFPIKFYYVKDKANRFNDLESYAEIFKEVESLLKANIEANNKMNWFTPEIQVLIEKLLELHTTFLGQGELPNLVKSGARYNLIWLLFLNADFELARSEIQALNQLKADLKIALKDPKSLSKTTKKDYKETVEAIHFFDLEKIELLISDFQPRYEINKEKLGW
jgi:hypothetical protein